ncbi:hypothetical protein B7463_g11623, partial [Scytalidium lignicola]
NNNFPPLPPTSQAAIHFLIRQYAILLLSSVLIALIFALRPVVDGTSRNVAGALAIYHLAPLSRAVWRVAGSGREVVFGDVNGNGGGLGGPWVHGFVHAVAFLTLALLWGVDGREGEKEREKVGRKEERGLKGKKKE